MAPHKGFIPWNKGKRGTYSKEYRNEDKCRFKGQEETAALRRTQEEFK